MSHCPHVILYYIVCLDASFVQYLMVAKVFDSTQWSGNYQQNIHMNARAVSEILRSSYPTDVVVT
jgi:hypothetical protein